MGNINNERYYKIRKKYLAEGLAFLGYRYRKDGFGKDTVYSFENNENFRKALSEFMELKNRVGQFLE